jgi:hypothetical protein
MTSSVTTNALRAQRLSIVGRVGSQHRVDNGKTNWLDAAAECYVSKLLISAEKVWRGGVS